ncbi:MAG: PKD domain-containing protein, partial [Bacteroidota bacterium]
DCDQLTVTTADLGLSITGGEAENISWVFENGTPATSDQEDFGSVTFTQSGSITVMVQSACGQITESIPVIVESSQQPSVAGNPVEFCTGSSVDTLVANPPTGQWSGPGVTGGGVFDPAAAGPGTHTLTYTLMGQVCSSSTELVVTVFASAVVTVQDESLCEDGDPVVLSANPPGGSWSGPQVTPDGTFDPTMAVPGVYFPVYTFEDTNGCSVNQRARVHVARDPVAMAQDTTQSCLVNNSQDLIELGSVTVDSTGGTFVCSLNGMPLTNCNFVPTTITPGAGFYPAQFTYTYGACSIVDSFVLEVIDNPTLALAPQEPICISEGTLTLSSNLSGGRWSGPGIDEITGVIDLNVAGGGSQTYTYVFGQGTSCEQSASQNVTIEDPGSQIQAGPNEAVCFGTATTFTLAAGSPNGGTWIGTGIIDPNGGIIDLDSIVPGQTYTYTYRIESQQSSNCSATATKTLTYHPRPRTNFTLDGTFCADEPFTISIAEMGNLSCTWDFGDGTIINNCNPSHTYSIPTNQESVDFTLTYSINENFNTPNIICSNDTSFTVTVTNPPIPSFTLDSLEGCAPFALGINDNSSGVDFTRLWCIGEDTISGMAPNDVVFDGFLTDTWVPITLKTTNFCGTRTQEDSVLVHPYPVVDFGFAVDNGCSPFSPEISNVTRGNPRTWFWDMGEGTTGTDSIPPSVSYLATDDTVVYQITLISTNECGADTLIRSITVYPPNVTAFIELDTVAGCQPYLLEPQSFSTPGSFLAWEVYNPAGDLIGTGNEAQPNFMLTDVGIHTIILEAARCGADRDTAFVEVLPAPEVGFTHDPQVCRNAPLAFTNTSPTLAGGSWDFGDGTTSDALNPTHVFDSAGIFTVTFTGFSPLNGCPATVSSEVTVVELPTPNFIPSDTAGCSPLAITFNNTSMALEPVVYTWDFGDGSNTSNAISPTHQFLDTGRFVVKLRVIDGNGCTNEQDFSFIRVHPDPLSALSG